MAVAPVDALYLVHFRVIVENMFTGQSTLLLLVSSSSFDKKSQL